MADWLPPGWAITQLLGTVAIGAVAYKVSLALIGVAMDALNKARK